MPDTAIRDYELKSIKTLNKQLMGVIIFVITIGISIITWYMNGVNKKLEIVASNTIELKSDVKELRLKNNMTEFKIAKIEARLDNAQNKINEIDKSIGGIQSTLSSYRDTIKKLKINE